VEEATIVVEDDSPVAPTAALVNQRNLSAWSVSMPFIDFYDDVVKREKIPVFCIDVERNDRRN
ncbi:Sorting nexin-14, partial [Xenoophorus captivus]